MQQKLKSIQPSPAVFLSPPWGGPGYREEEVFNLETMEPYGATKIMKAARNISEDVALYVPRTSDLNQLAQLEEEGKLIEGIHYCLERKSKVIWSMSTETVVLLIDSFL